VVKDGNAAKCGKGRYGVKGVRVALTCEVYEVEAGVADIGDAVLRDFALDDAREDAVGAAGLAVHLGLPHMAVSGAVLQQAHHINHRVHVLLRLPHHVHPRLDVLPDVTLRLHRVQQVVDDLVVNLDHAALANVLR
jgi:hypothetical protein